MLACPQRVLKVALLRTKGGSDAFADRGASRVSIDCCSASDIRGVLCGIVQQSTTSRKREFVINIANKNGGAAPDSRESGTDSSVDIKDPDRFSLSMTISAQEINNEPSSMPTLQFGFTRFDSDRRWTFHLPAPLGQVVYLEKSGLMYLILSDRKQYVELNPNDLGFQMGRAMTPSAIANQLKARARVELSASNGQRPEREKIPIQKRAADSGRRDLCRHRDGIAGESRGQ